VSSTSSGEAAGSGPVASETPAAQDGPEDKGAGEPAGHLDPINPSQLGRQDSAPLASGSGMDLGGNPEPAANPLEDAGQPELASIETLQETAKVVCQEVQRSGGSRDNITGRHRMLSRDDIGQRFPLPPNLQTLFPPRRLTRRVDGVQTERRRFSTMIYVAP
jgi:hypothetical protein